MKKLTFNLFVITISSIVVFSSCDPPPTGEWTFDFTANARLNNNNETLSVGDTLKAYFELPDTLYLENGLGERKVVTDQKPSGGFMGYKLYSIDTTAKTAQLNYIDNGIDAYVCPGTIDVVGTPVFQVSQRPYGFILNMVARKKGLYCFFFDAAMGGRYFTGNNASDEVYKIRPKLITTNLHPHLGTSYLTSDWQGYMRSQSKDQAYYFWVR